MRGPGGLRFEGCGGVVSVIGSGAYSSVGLGTGTYQFDVCIVDTASFAVRGTVSFTTRTGAKLLGTIGGSIPGGPSTSPYQVTVTGGTKRFRHARGSLVIGPLLEAQSHNCDPRTGFCLDWTDSGPLSGTLTHVRRR
ncbi:MAG: hypothetical protein ABJC79_06825 [Acidimicrobiia bacterium]